MQLTKEQLDAIANQMDCDPFLCDMSEGKELLRGYRAHLAEVEEHEKSIKFLHNIGADGGPAEEYHISRLLALKGEG